MNTVSPDSVAQDQIKAFVERIERLEEERKAIARDIAEVYAEAKGNGFDRKALKQVVRIRSMDHNARMELEALVDLYLSALGMASSFDAFDDEDERRPHVHVHVREEQPAHDPETGEIIEPQAQPVQTGHAATMAPTTQAGLVAVESPATVFVQDSGDDGEGQAGATREHGSGELSQPLLPNDRVENTPDGQAVIVAEPFPEPAEGTTPTSADHGDRGAVVPSAAPVVEPFVAEYAAPGVVVVERCPPEGIVAHPFAACWPVNSIDVTDGVRQPIVKIGKLILDGRGRYFAARDAGIEYPVVQYDGTDPLLDCIRWNLASRKPSEQQRRLIAQKLAKLEPSRADEIMLAFDRHLEAAE